MMEKEMEIEMETLGDENLSDIGKVSELVRNRIQKEEDSSLFLQTQEEWYFGVGILVQYVLRRIARPEDARQGKRHALLHSKNAKALRESISNLIQKELLMEVRHPHKKVELLAGAILGFNIDSVTMEVQNGYFIQGLIIQDSTWYKKPAEARAEKWQKENGVIAKTYKLEQSTVEDFAEACKRKGVSQAKALTGLMEEFSKK